MHTQKEIGERLARLRGERTQKEVSKAINTTVSAIGNYEAGQRMPRDKVKIVLANYYNVSVEQLFFT